MPVSSRTLCVVGPLSLLASALMCKANGAAEKVPGEKTTLTKGLAIWRKPGRIQAGAACATCHSPDGIELAAFDFSDANLLRRARPHLGDEDSRIVIAYVHALRRKMGFHHLMDPDRDRPLQPGGRVLQGSNASDRDIAFGQELQKKLPRFFQSRITTIAEAKKAEAELLALNPRTLPVGIPLNRLSEDAAHGNDHSSVAQWLPELPPLVPQRALAQWYSAEDAYLARPSASSLNHLVELHEKLINPYRQLGLVALSTLKFRALLVFQDRLRRNEVCPSLEIASDVTGPGKNPIWEVGDMARQLVGRDPNSLGMDASIQARKLLGPKLERQLQELRASWFWSGWLSDQGLFQTGADDKTRLGMWMSDSLSVDGPYPIHNAYACARRQAVISSDLTSWSGPVSSRRRIWDFGALRIAHRDVVDMPQAALHRKLYSRFVANAYRMNLLLLADDMRRTHSVWVKISSRSSAADMLNFIERVDPSHAGETEDLRTKVFGLIEGAEDRSS